MTLMYFNSLSSIRNYFWWPRKLFLRHSIVVNPKIKFSHKSVLNSLAASHRQKKTTSEWNKKNKTELNTKLRIIQTKPNNSPIVQHPRQLRITTFFCSLYSKWLNSSIRSIDGTQTLKVRVDVGVMAMKGYSTFPRVLEVDPNNSIVLWRNHLLMDSTTLPNTGRHSNTKSV